MCRLLLSLCTLASLWAARSEAASFSRFGDVEIFSNATTFKCDKIFCPGEANRCQVIKQKEANNATLIRQNICYGKDNNNAILLEQSFSEQVNPRDNVALNVNSYRNGFTSSVQSSINTAGSNVNQIQNANVDKELELHLGNAQRITQDMNLQLNNINANIERNLQNMRKELQESLGNMRIF